MDYKGEFDGATGTSKFVSDLNGKNDEIHVIVIDQDGLITGTPDTVLETFPFLSVAKNAKRADGTSNFYKDVLRLQSDWVYAGRLHTGDSAGVSDFIGSNWDTNAVKTGTTQDFKSDFVFSSAQNDFGFHSGVTSSSLGTDDVLRGFDKFEDKDNIEVDFLIAPESLTDTSATTIVNDLVSTSISP